MNDKHSSLPWFWFALAATLAVFLALLGLRTGWLKPSPDAATLAPATDIGTEEAWMAIYQNGQKIGFSQRRREASENGFVITDKTYLRINTMGMTQTVHVDTVGHLGRDLSLAAFDFRLRSNLFAFAVRGEIEGRKLRLTVDGRLSEITLDGPIHLVAGILNGPAVTALADGRPRVFRVFDPATLAKRSITVTPEDQETIDVMGQPTITRKLSIEFAGVTALAWVDEAGRVVQEQGPMGFQLRRTSRREATAGLQDTATADMTELAAVPVATAIDKPSELTRLTLRVSGIQKQEALNGGRQEFADGLLTVRRETVPSPASLDTDDLKIHLAPTALIQSDHPEIVKAVADIIDGHEAPALKVEKLLAWVYTKLEKRPVISVPSAVEVLRQRMGDCNEHAVLMAALARAVGIPARVETGLVYLRGSFFYHAWNSVWLGCWVTVDALMNQIPADVTHIRLVAPDTDSQLDLMGMIGQIKLEVIETRFD